MKKICISFMILFLILSSQVFAMEDWNKKNLEREKAFEAALPELLEPYKEDSVEESQRIIDYTLSGFGVGEEKDGKLEASINFWVTPYSEENTIWQKGSNICFATFSVIDGEYKLDSISLTPKNYDKFLERFEEYEKNNIKNVEIQETQCEKIENLKVNQIEKMSNFIFIISTCLLILLISITSFKIVKSKRKK